MSLLRYPGGKTKACTILDEYYGQYANKIKTVYSPFCGGCSFEIFLAKKYKVKVLANDAFPELINFWCVAKTKPKELTDEIKKIKSTITKEKFYALKQEIIGEKDTVKLGAYFYALNRCSFSGSTMSGGFSAESVEKRFTMNCINKIQGLDLSGFTFSNKDFSVFLDEIPDEENTMIFLDPPYYLDVGKRNLYGNKGNLHKDFDHNLLYNKIMTKKKCLWIQCYNNCQYIRDLYKDYIIHDASWTYGMNKSKVSSEVIITLR